MGQHRKNGAPNPFISDEAMSDKATLPLYLWGSRRRRAREANRPVPGTGAAGRAALFLRPPHINFILIPASLLESNGSNQTGQIKRVKSNGSNTPRAPRVHGLSPVCVCVCVCARARVCVRVCVCGLVTGQRARRSRGADIMCVCVCVCL